MQRMTNSEHHAQLLAGIHGLGGRLSYTPAQAAAVTGRSRSRIFKAIKDGELQALKDGKATLLTDVELRRWLGSLPTIGREPQAA
jgi:excisionase family DNA binding protein